MVRKTTIAKTLCKDGFVVSTVNLDGAGMAGCDYETAEWSKGGTIGVIDRYEDARAAIDGHAGRIKLHGG